MMLSREMCRPGIMNKFAGHQVQVAVLIFLYSYISDISYWTYCPRKEPSSDCNKYSTLVENEGRAWISKRVLTGKSLRPEPSSPLWGARWINSKFLFNFLRKRIYSLFLCCLQECDRGKARLTEGESFNCEGVFQNFTLKHRLVLLSKGLKEIRSSNSSSRSTGKRWEFVTIHSRRQVRE